MSGHGGLFGGSGRWEPIVPSYREMRCPRCGRETRARVDERIVSTRVEGCDVVHRAHMATCTACGREIEDAGLAEESRRLAVEALERMRALEEERARGSGAGVQGTLGI